MDSDRLPPQNLDAERCLLGSLLLDATLLPEALKHCQWHDLYDLGHRQVFQALQAVVERGDGLDVVTLREELAKRNAGDGLCDLDYLFAFTNDVPAASNAPYYAKIIKDKAGLRRVIEFTSRIQARAMAPDASPDKLYAIAARALSGVDLHEGSKKPEPIIDALNDVFDIVDGKSEPMLPTGYVDIDALVGGFKPGLFYVVAARPSHGKTTLVVNILTRLAMTHGVPCGLISLEMRRVEIFISILCAVGLIPSDYFTRRHFPQQIIDKIHEVTTKNLAEFPLVVDDSSTLTPSGIRAKVSQMMREHQIKLVAVDYLQLIRDEVGGNTRRDVVAAACSDLKAMAKDFNIPVIAIAQLNRQAAGIERLPIMSDLGECGQTEQDADVLMLLSRREMSDPNCPESEKGKALLDIVKNKGGARKKVTLTARLEHFKFDNFTG